MKGRRFMLAASLAAGMAAVIGAGPAESTAPKLQAVERLVTIDGKPARLTSRLLFNRKILSTMFYFNSTHHDVRPDVRRWLTEIAQEDGLTVDFVEPPGSDERDPSGFKPE